MNLIIRLGTLLPTQQRNLNCVVFTKLTHRQYYPIYKNSYSFTDYLLSKHPNKYITVILMQSINSNTTHDYKIDLSN